MSTVVLNQEPATLVAGSTVTWKKEDPDYAPSDGFTLTYHFRGNAVGASFSVVATTSTSGDYWEATITNAKTEGLPAGAYGWQAQISDGTTKHVIGSGTLLLQADFADTDAPYDPRSEVKKTLDIINQAIQDKVFRDQSSYSIAGRSLNRIPLTELIQLRDKYSQMYGDELRAERMARGEGFFRTVKTRFRDAQ